MFCELFQQIKSLASSHEPAFPPWAEPISEFVPCDSGAATLFPERRFECSQSPVWTVLFDARGKSGTIAKAEYSNLLKWRHYLSRHGRQLLDPWGLFRSSSDL